MLAIGLVVLAVVAFGFAAYRYAASRQAPQLAIALGLAFLALVVGILAGVPPPIPPEPPIPDGGDFGGYRPHLQGFGATTRGGRGGLVCTVDTLTIDGAATFGARGGLDDCVAPRPGCADTWESCARIAVFAVSGTASAGVGYVSVTAPYLTIAGQTAPEGGYTLAGARLLIDTHDVYLGHIRIRRPPVSLNALSIGDAGDGGDNSHVRNVIVDHVSVSWATDVNNYLQAGPGSSAIMLVNSLVCEGLWSGALGGIGVGVGGDATVIGNVFCHHWSRQPIWGSPARIVVANNAIYNGTNNQWAADTLPAFFGDADGDGSTASASQTMVIANVLIPGPDSGAPPAFLGFSKKQGSIDAGSKSYLQGNQGPGITGPRGDEQWIATVCGNYGTYSNAATCGPASNMRTDQPFAWFDPATRVVTTDVLAAILANAGARPVERDSADARVIADVTEGDGTHYLDWTTIETRYGGMPTITARTRTPAIPANPNAPGSRTLLDGTRNTVIEDWLETEAQRLEPARGGTRRR